FYFMERPTRFALSVGAMFLVVTGSKLGEARTLFTERNFFGIVRVQDDQIDKRRHLAHGSTSHGFQQLTPDGQPDPACEPLSYFTRSGPIGQVFKAFAARTGDRPVRVGVTGLGVGALASYARPNEDWVYYEIDPAIVRVAWDSGLFTFKQHSRAKSLEVLVGDARLRLREAADASYDLLVLDAFSSDSVPTHLLNRQALDLYLAKLKPDGILAFNVTNRYLDLKPVLADLAGAMQPPLACYAFDDTPDRITHEQANAGKVPA